MSSYTLPAFKQRLYDLGGRNVNIRHLRLRKGKDLDLAALDAVTANLGWRTLAALLEGRERLRLIKVSDARDQRSNQLSTQLNEIMRLTRTIEEETGNHNLYIGYPYLHGRFKDGRAVRGPLVLFQLDLVREENYYYLQAKPGSRPLLNQALLLAYKLGHDANLSTQTLLEAFNDDFDDALQFRNQLYAFLTQTGLQINFNTELFTDRLIPFVDYKKEEFDALTELGVLKLQPEAVLGLYHQADAYLGQDYDQLIALGLDVETIFETIGPRQPAGLEEGEEDESADSTTPKPSLVNAIINPAMATEILPFELDAAQESVINSLQAGQSLVVQGPPGTGKSQLICNIAASYLAAGKQVLVICQKRAALDVVYERLSGLGIARHLALVHDLFEDRPGLYKQIGQLLEEGLTAAHDPLPQLNATALRMQASVEQIDRGTGYLERFKSALFDTSLAGLSPKWMYLHSERQAPVYVLDAQLMGAVKLDHWFARRNQVIEVLGAGLRWYQPGLLIADDWRTIAQWNDRQYEAAVQVLTQVIPVLRPLHFEFANLPDAQLQQGIAAFQQTQRLQAQQWPMLQTLLALDAGGRQRFEMAAATVKSLTGLLAGQNITLAQARRWQALLPTTLPDLSGWLGRMAYQVFNGRSYKQIAQALTESGHDFSRLPALQSLISQRLELQAGLDELAKLLGNEAPEGIEAIRHWMQQWQSLFAESVALKQQPLYAHLDRSLPLEQQFSAAAHQASNYLDLKSQAFSALPAEKVITVINERSEAVYLSELQQYINSIRNYYLLLQSFSESEQKVITASVEQASSLNQSPAEAWQQLLNSLCHYWLQQSEERWPELRDAIDPQALPAMEESLMAAWQEKTQLSRELLAQVLEAQTLQYIAHGSARRRGQPETRTALKLRQEVGKKRNIWPIRKLMQQYGQEILTMIPLWLASPEAVSGIFPLEQQFDLIIFDEASQCFSEKGIPGIYRAKQLLITGDEKQLQPSSTFASRFDTDEETEEQAEALALQAESLLALARTWLPGAMLTGHYRSRHLSLISFSNQQFYDSRLQALPHRADFNSPEPAIRVHHVPEGLWQNQTNLPEAQQVLALVQQLAQQQPGRSLGVITFNIKQKNLIEDLIEQQGLDWPLPPQFFVKNIENVQGDERDIIVFSFGYAPDAAGRLLNFFGSLSAQGGENRLNVAVTRARHAVHIVTSLRPGQLQTANSAHAGPRLLAQYLDYAWQVSQGQLQHGLAQQANSEGQAVALKDKLAQTDPQLKPGLPFADLGRVQGQQFAQALFTDDQLLQRQSARAHFVYLPQLLRNKDWPWARRFSRHWWQGQR